MGDMMPLQEEQVEDVWWTGSAWGVRRGWQRAVGASVVRGKLYGLHRDGGNLGDDVSQFDVREQKPTGNVKISQGLRFLKASPASFIEHNAC